MRSIPCSPLRPPALALAQHCLTPAVRQVRVPPPRQSLGNVPLNERANSLHVPSVVGATGPLCSGTRSHLPSPALSHVFTCQLQLQGGKIPPASRQCWYNALLLAEFWNNSRIAGVGHPVLPKAVRKSIIAAISAVIARALPGPVGTEGHALTVDDVNLAVAGALGSRGTAVTVMAVAQLVVPVPLGRKRTARCAGLSTCLPQWFPQFMNAINSLFSLTPPSLGIGPALPDPGRPAGSGPTSRAIIRQRSAE